MFAKNHKSKSIVCRWKCPPVCLFVIHDLLEGTFNFIQVGGKGEGFQNINS